MRECFVNVYPNEPEHRRLGVPSETRELAADRCANRRECEPPEFHAAFRVHVRLKPEGAPALYRDDAQRWAWEDAERRGTTPRYD